MEHEEDTSTMSPFWVPNGDHRNRRRLRRSYSLLLTSASLLVLLLVMALVLALVVVPTLRSFTSNIFRPQAVKHSWDSLNLILVLFAVVCGFLTKNDTHETQTPRFDNHNRHQPGTFSNPSTPPPWYEYSNRSLNRLRSFGSNPDLRQHSPWVASDERCRFYDDTDLLLRHRHPILQAEDERAIEKVATVTSGEVSASPVRKSETQPPPATRTKAVQRNAERTYQAETIEKPESNDLVSENSQPPPQPPAVRRRKRGIVTKENGETVTYAEFGASPVPQPATRTKAVRKNAKRTYQAEMIEKPENNDFDAEISQPPPPPPSPPPPAAERKTNMGKKKRGVATKEFLTSLRGKKKKQRQRSVENFESILNSEPFPLVSQPPPPPPPPPPSVFHNLFSTKKSKNKKSYLVAVATHKVKPLLPSKREQSYYSLEDNNVMITGNESPLIPIPPPPPPPPFKLPAWKFRVQGDFVRVDSIGSSRSGSPDLDEVVESPMSQGETSQGSSPYAPHGEEPASASATSAASLFCPSPDVDTKAHNFIQSFRAGLRMAKMNSMKEKQGIGRSNLGPLPNP